MRAQPVTASQNRRIVAGLPFVEALARRMAASMPHSIDIGDLVQDGVLGLIDAAHRFDADRGIKFETFAERRVRGAMIDALRRDAWPRGVRRQRRELEAAREALRRELGHEPSMADLAARVGSDEKKLSRTIVRINTIESTSPLATGEHLDETSLPAALVPSEPDAPDSAYEKSETRDRVRAAIASLPARERKVIGLYYYGEVTMKQIGAEIGVNESRVSQLHARAIRRLRDSLGDMGPQQVAEMRKALLAFAARKPQMAKADLPERRHELPVAALVIPYKTRKDGRRAQTTLGLPKGGVREIHGSRKVQKAGLAVRQAMAVAR
jgi:RNA polymerase sigma factor for flagellar operon FliA